MDFKGSIRGVQKSKRHNAELTQKGFDMKKALKSFFDLILLVLGLDCEARREAVDNNYCDFSGQGKNKYGR